MTSDEVMINVFLYKMFILPLHELVFIIDSFEEGGLGEGSVHGLRWLNSPFRAPMPFGACWAEDR